MERDFTYIDDVIDAILKILIRNEKESYKHRIFNIGNNKPQKLMYFIRILEKSFSEVLKRNIVFEKKYESMKVGDVKKTFASIEKLEKFIDFRPNTSIESGLKKFANWYVTYYKIR